MSNHNSGLHNSSNSTSFFDGFVSNSYRYVAVIFLLSVTACTFFVLNTFRADIDVADQGRTYKVLNPVCHDLGYTANITVKDKHYPLHYIHRHTFVFPPPLDNTFLCVPSKNGNKNWGGLFYKLWYGKVLQSDAIDDDDLRGITKKQGYDPYNDHMWMVTRSPYVRLLSTYLEKVLCGPEGCQQHDYKGGFRYFRGNLTFDRFVAKIHSIVLRGRPETRVAPLQRVQRLCEIDHHLCPQATCLFKLKDNRVRILKLEDQGKWFANFTRCFDLTPEDVIGPEWQAHNNQNCFYTPTDDCKDALTPVTNASLPIGGVHGKGAVNLVAAYYTPAAAQMVSYLYEYDFVHLRQKLWDGTPSSLV